MGISNLIIIFLLFCSIESQKVINKNNLKTLARWCCINTKEVLKCEQWKFALQVSNKSNILLECVLGSDKFDCYHKIFDDEADLIAADAGDIYTAGKYYNLAPISSELYSSRAGILTNKDDIYAVAIVKRGSGMTINKLKGSNSCHGGVGTSAGWNIPISTLIDLKLLEIIDCNNHVKAATKFFKRMCAPDALTSQFNPTGDNPTSVCELCIGKIGSTFCTNQDPFAGYIGALYCLNDGGGDVAFVRHTDIFDLSSYNRSINLNDYELLCPNIGKSKGPLTATVNDYLTCNWGKIPGRAILTSGRKALQQKNDYKEFLKFSANQFSGQSPSSLSEFNIYKPQITTTTPRPWFLDFSYFSPFPAQLNIDLPAEIKSFKFYLFDSRSFNERNLIFIDQTNSFQDIDNTLNYVSYLNSKSPDYLNKILKLYECPLRLVRWCVISNYEKDKCRLMKHAFSSRNIKPDIDCVSAKNKIECMSMVSNRLADLVSLDPADAYRASIYYGLKPLASEDYGSYDTQSNMPIYYAIAVVKRTNLETNLWNLRNKRVCGTAIGEISGWNAIVDYLIGIKEIYVEKNCHISKAVGEYFGRSCIPGAQDYSYNTLKTSPRSLCGICYSKGADFCSRNHKEMFYGDTGAFRCLTEGRGDVSFVRHTSVKPNTDGRNTDQWARPLRLTDFELICKDGTRRSVEKYKDCHLAKVPARLVMIGGYRDNIQRNYLWNMLNFAQQIFGSDTNQDFTMFESFKEHPDLIFNDATVQLIKIESSIEDYLGKDLISLLYRTDDRLCNRSNRHILSIFFKKSHFFYLFFYYYSLIMY